MNLQFTKKSLNFVSIPTLQGSLGRLVGPSWVRRLIENFAQEGVIVASPSGGEGLSNFFVPVTNSGSYSFFGNQKFIEWIFSYREDYVKPSVFSGLQNLLPA